MTGLHRTDGDGWVTCTCGERHWGRYGAAGLLVVDREDGTVLLQHRATWSHYGDTWGAPGGARARGEPAQAAALREAAEEAAVDSRAVRLAYSWTEDHGAWSYTTVVAHTTEPVEARASDPESREIRWVPIDEVADLPLHPGFAAAWPILRPQLTRTVVVLVDAANVVGSRPDGWWRDRQAATERLRDSLDTWVADGVPAAAIDLPPGRWWPYIQMVVEGAARGVQPTARIEVVESSRDGDTEMVTAARQRLANDSDVDLRAVTADRALTNDLSALGVTVIRPTRFLTLL